MEQVTLEAMMRRLSRVAERMFDERGEVEMCWLSIFRAKVRHSSSARSS
jgi:hypothetical protein